MRVISQTIGYSLMFLTVFFTTWGILLWLGDIYDWVW